MQMFEQYMACKPVANNTTRLHINRVCLKPDGTDGTDTEINTDNEAVATRAGEMERRTAWATDGVAQGQTGVQDNVHCVKLSVIFRV